MRAPVLAAALCLAAAPSPAQTLPEPPPGWRDARGPGDGPEVLVSLKGPETSSFLLRRIPRLDAENRAAVRALLVDLLASINRSTGLGFTVAGGLQATTFDNGLTAFYLRADLKGQPRLVVAAGVFAETPMVAILMSSVPETMMPSLLGALQADPSRAAAPRLARAVSLDGQLLFSLPAGLAARPVTPHERKLGFVLALHGLDSELMVMKLVDDKTPAAQQPEIVRKTVLAAGGADPATAAAPRLLATPPGPDLVYSWATVREPAGDTLFAAGYLPWCYWGYSILAKGPRAPELLTASFEALALGPSALPRLVAKSPQIPGRRAWRLSRLKRLPPRFLGAAAAFVLVLLALAVWLLRKRRS